MAHRSEFVSVAGVRTHLFRGGRGTPLLVLHPEFGSNRWFPYHDRLAARFQIFAPDHPGFGQSERPEWLDGIDDLVFHYADLLDALGLARVSILGTSLGGWIAAEFAVTHPQRLHRIVLVGAGGIKVEGADRFDVFIHSVEETLQHSFHDPSRAAQLLPTEFGPDSIVDTYREAATLARLTWNPYFYDPKLPRRLRRITAPTLIVWGDDDRFLPAAHGEAYARLIPTATLQTIPECGHLVPLEQTDLFIQHVVRFLEAGA
ncbi:MAG: alpha/beta fold hydrolase [Candidatus Binatia bacterium]